MYYIKCLVEYKDKQGVFKRKFVSTCTNNRKESIKDIHNYIEEDKEIKVIVNIQIIKEKLI